MVKIKVEKKMNLAELIQYIVENDIKNECFTNQDYIDVNIDSNGEIYITDWHNTHGIERINPKSIFDVETVEKITKETKIPLLLEICTDFESGKTISYVSKYESVARQCNENSISFHMVNQDSTTTLLWTKNRGMVE